MGFESISLQSNIRANLVALQGTSKLLARTEERLASGKDVNNIIDNPTNFFAARNLNDRSSALNSRLDGMGQAIQTINAANAGIDAIRNLIANLKAIVTDAMADSSVTNRRTLGDQFNTVLDQITELAGDSGYQGVNLLSDHQKLSIEFGENNGDSILRVKGISVDGDNGGGTSAVTSVGTATRASVGSLGATTSVGSHASLASRSQTSSAGSFASVSSVASSSSVAAQPSVGSQGSVGGASSQASVGSVASVASTSSVASASSVASSASVGSLGSVSSQVSVASRAAASSVASSGSVSVTFTQSYALTMRIDAQDTGNDNVVGLKKHLAGQEPSGNGGHTLDFGSNNYIDRLTTLSQDLDKFDEALKMQASRLATNLNIVTVREEFTEDMINTLSEGADKLVLADMNEEGANLLALQTRQALGVQSLSISSQESQQILRLLS